MASSTGPVPPAPNPSWRFELLHPGCVHRTQYVTKAVFLFLDSVSVLGLLLLSGRLLRHRWRTQRQQQQRWAAAGDGEKEKSSVGRRAWARWRWCWSVVLGCGVAAATTTTRTTIGDLLERLVLKLCMWELGFYLADYFYLLDCNVPTAIGTSHCIPVDAVQSIVSLVASIHQRRQNRHHRGLRDGPAP